MLIQSDINGAGTPVNSYSKGASKAVSSYKSRIPPSLVRWSVFTLDIICASLAAIYTLVHYQGGVFDIALRTAAPYMLIPLAAILGLAFAGAYSLGHTRSLDQHLRRALTGAGIGLVVVTTLLWVFSAAPGKYLMPTLIIWAITGGLHLAYFRVMKRLFKAGHLSEKVIMVGATDKAVNLINQNRSSGDMRVLGIFDDRLKRSPGSIDDVPLIGTLDDLITWDRLPEIDRIIITVNSEARDRVKHLIDRLRPLPQRIVLLLDYSSFNPERAGATQIYQAPAAYVSGEPANLERALAKRVGDLIFAALLLIGFSPIMAITALLIKLEDGGPIFFRQLRHGFNNELIRVWKFRSMAPNEAAADKMTDQTVANDPRVTRIGRFIRATSIDELPQLFNVLTGCMSIVGPRPHAVGMTAGSTRVHEIVGEYAHRHRAKPGITGWAQINGSRGPVHTHEEVRERVRLDMEYLKRSSFFFDIYIMIMTAPCLLGDRLNNR